MNTANMPLTVECGDIRAKGYPVSKYTGLDIRTKNGREYRFARLSPGYEISGSAMRLLQCETWSVTFQLDGARHGKRFPTFEKAAEYFWTATH